MIKKSLLVTMLVTIRLLQASTNSGYHGDVDNLSVDLLGKKLTRLQLKACDDLTLLDLPMSKNQSPRDNQSSPDPEPATLEENLQTSSSVLRAGIKTPTLSPMPEMPQSAVAQPCDGNGVLKQKRLYLQTKNIHRSRLVLGTKRKLDLLSDGDTVPNNSSVSDDEGSLRAQRRARLEAPDSRNLACPQVLGRYMAVKNNG